MILFWRDHFEGFCSYSPARVLFYMKLAGLVEVGWEGVANEGLLLLWKIVNILLSYDS